MQAKGNDFGKVNATSGRQHRHVNERKGKETLGFFFRSTYCLSSERYGRYLTQAAMWPVNREIVRQPINIHVRTERTASGDSHVDAQLVRCERPHSTFSFNRTSWRRFLAELMLAPVARLCSLSILELRIVAFLTGKNAVAHNLVLTLLRHLGLTIPVSLIQARFLV